MVIEDDRVAMAITLADTAEACPDRGDSSWPQDRSTGRFVKDLIAFVHYLNVLGQPHGTVGIGRGAVAYHTWKRDTVKIEDGRGHDIRDQASQYAVVNDRVRHVYVEGKGQLRIQIRFVRFPVFRWPWGPNRRKITQRR